MRLIIPLAFLVQYACKSIDAHNPSPPAPGLQLQELKVQELPSELQECVRNGVVALTGENVTCSDVKVKRCNDFNDKQKKAVLKYHENTIKDYQLFACSGDKDQPTKAYFFRKDGSTINVFVLNVDVPE